MANASFVKMDIKKMQQLYQGLKQKADIQVGVFSGGARHNGNIRSTGSGKKKKTDSGLTNASLAAIHELGSPEHGLPARSMLKVPIADHAQEIINVFKGKADAYLYKGTLEKLYKLVGIACEKVVDGAFASGGYGKWAPLRYETLLGKLRKGHRNLHWRKLTIAQIYAGNIGMGILIKTAQLRRAFSSRVRMSF